MSDLSPNPAPSTDLFTLAEVAEYLRCSERHAWKLAKDGLIPPVRLGNRCIRYRRVDVIAAVETMVKGAKPAAPVVAA